LTAVAAGLAMPLARSVQSGAAGSPERVQRQTEGAGAPTAAGAGSSPAAAGAPAAAGETAPSQVDEDELAERVLRRLMRTLAVESERRGLRRWTS
jgi:hypothetical protein